MFGICVLFFANFLFLANLIFSKNIKAKYGFAICFMFFVLLPIIFVLWDFYSIATLFYSLFGGISYLSLLLLVNYILQNILLDFCKNHHFYAHIQNFQKSHNKNLAYMIICVFSLVLYLGHLGFIGIDFLQEFSVIFAGIFVGILYLANKLIGFLALASLFLAVIFKENIMFSLFDGYLFIFSVIYCVVLVISYARHKIAK